MKKLNAIYLIVLLISLGTGCKTNKSGCYFSAIEPSSHSFDVNCPQTVFSKNTLPVKP
ncbi:MAG: hypothetical protein H7X99_04540 [Saprospiraceae bacterium]|nr:hypothetical protein [Saprospiraceae bacterium]